MDLVDQQLEKVKDLQYLINELRIDYLCFDYKIIAFCVMDPNQILSKIYENLHQLDDNNNLNSIITQLRDFCNYYEVQSSDIEILHSLLDELFTLFDRKIPLSYEEFSKI
jgi:hypothetical protein